MTHGGGGSLVVDAEVRRGSFTLAVSLTAAPGQVLGVLGPNGAGKSTLLSAVAGLTPISAGRITLAERVMDDAESGTFVEASGRPVGVGFQHYRLFPHLTLAPDVALPPRARGRAGAARAGAAGPGGPQAGRAAGGAGEGGGLGRRAGGAAGTAAAGRAAVSAGRRSPP